MKKIVIHGWKDLAVCLGKNRRVARKLHGIVPVPRLIAGKPVLTEDEFFEWLNLLNGRGNHG